MEEGPLGGSRTKVVEVGGSRDEGPAGFWPVVLDRSLILNSSSGDDVSTPLCFALSGRMRSRS